jgi:glycosyltransferase involved in cell wall biosynthesis
VTGYLLEPGDVEGLARRVGELLEDEPLRRRLGAQALSRVAPWDIDAMVRRQERLYEDLVAKGVEIAVARSTQEEANG